MTYDVKIFKCCFDQLKNSGNVILGNLQSSNVVESLYGVYEVAHQHADVIIVNCETSCVIIST